MPLFSVSIPRVSGRLRPWHRALVAVLAGAAATAGHSQWLQSGYDSAKTYANTEEKILTPSNATSLTVKWQAQLSPFPISATTQSDGRIIACSSSLGLSAFDAGTGAVLWSQPMADYVTCKSPALQDGAAYVTTFSNPAVLNTHWFSATDQTSGTLLVSEKREFNPATYIDDTHPTLAGDRLYLASAAYSIVALDRATGHVVWNNQTIKSAGNRGLSVADGRVFVSTWFTPNCCRPPNEGVFAFNAETGSRLWEYRVKGRNMSQLPMALGGNVYVGDSEGVIHGLSAKDGSLLWRRQLSDQLRSPLVGRGDTIFAGNYDGQVYALKASTGKPVWSRQLAKSNPGQLVSNMVWANGMLFMTTLGSNVHRLLVLNADTGNILANLVDQPLPGYGAWVTVADGRVQVSTPNGYLYVFGL